VVGAALYALWPHTDNVAATINEDKLAIDCYSYAETTGQPITLGLVERRLDELRAHGHEP
jgi:hypothetical protein